MEIPEIIFTIIITVLVIYFSFFISQNVFIFSKSQEQEILVSIDINTATRYLWKMNCSNSTEYSFKKVEISNLAKYQCSVLPCFINYPIPVFFVINYSNFIYRFGICSLDIKKCNVRKNYLLIDHGEIAELYTNICYDDLSRLTVLLQYYCTINKNFEFFFSNKIKNLTVKNNTICLENLCNNIFCERFLTDYEIYNVSAVYFRMHSGFYKVSKIS